MKKLKLQKALLAICLALPLTLKINNEINAMETKGAPNGQNPIKNEAETTINKEEISTNKILELSKGNHYTSRELEQEYEHFLSSHNTNDINKYLALLIQANYRETPDYGEKNGVNLA